GAAAAPGWALGSGYCGQRGPLGGRGDHSHAGARGGRLLGRHGDHGDLGRAPPPGEPGNRERGLHDPLAQRALRGPERTAGVLGRTLNGRAKVTSEVLYFADLVQKRLVNLDELADTSLASLIQQQRLGPEFQNVFLDSLRIENLELEMGSDVWLRSNEANIQL